MYMENQRSERRGGPEDPNQILPEPEDDRIIIPVPDDRKVPKPKVSIPPNDLKRILEEQKRKPKYKNAGNN